jgi:hypothetical protein
MIPAGIRSLARLFDARAEGSPLAPQGEVEARYAAVLGRLDEAELDVPGLLVGAGFRPFFLLNGLLHASRLEEDGVRSVCRALALGLDQFAEYFAARDGDHALPDGAVMREQARYFAFLTAQMPEVGMGLDGILPTMKADAADLGTAHAVREILEGGPQVLVASRLIPDDERALWRRIFGGEGRAADELRDLLVSKWGLRIVRHPGN